MVTADQLQILQHALGVDEYGRFPRGWRDFTRNHFCAGGGDETVCRELVAMGYMRTWTGADDRGQVPGYPYFNCSVTEEGKAAMRRESPAPPKLSRSKQRYRRYVDSGAGDCGWTFGEWLKERRYREPVYA